MLRSEWYGSDAASLVLCSTVNIKLFSLIFQRQLRRRSEDVTANDSGDDKNGGVDSAYTYQRHL